MKKRIGILHAHYSNIAYIEEALTGCDVELLHFVDPGLVYRVGSDESFSEEQAAEKVNRQVEWIAACHVDIILITCTNYIALLQEDQLAFKVPPIVKIDEPFFEKIISLEEPQILLFTNPATVEGTMNRLCQYAKANGKSPQIEARIIGDAFQLVMQGKKEQTHRIMTDYIRTLLESESGKANAVSVAQLSMVGAARAITAEYGFSVQDPLAPLAAHLRTLLQHDTDEAL
ncbi:hypothetical protein [Gorillibacterium massiliense]|uniref:hypothetical protein n=1 Tax=Gorillibacterium massiliense TaxID=1280390 RepID=UPI0004B17A00|nr:hypothetical protein [Gorillibacterium massiliense]